MMELHGSLIPEQHSGGANINLSNLSATKINAALLPDTTNKRNFGNAY